ncbi:MAG: NAD(P)H-dependent glycerol-3-phosphate dehydrogenase [Pseudomonadota bacterium]
MASISSSASAGRRELSSGEPQVGVIGAGAWGTALAILANRAGSHTTLWTRNPQVIDSIHARRENAQYLPDQFIDPAIAVTDDSAFVSACDMLVVTIPAQSLRTVAISLSDKVPANVPIIVATKGIERGSLMLMSEVLQSILPHNPYAILSGPNFAREAAAGLPTATTLATHHAHLTDKMIFALGGKYFRLYVNDDPIGTQIGGAVKNVLAIAAGIVEGRGLGENARAALITRGLVEMTRLARAKGGSEETLMGLSGIGDMMLTCMSTKSRNYALGVAIGRGGIARGGALTEGVATAESVSQLARKLGVAMPIAFAVHEVLSGAVPVAAAIEKLLERPVVSEG